MIFPPIFLSYLRKDVAELEVDPAHGEDGAMDEPGITRQTRQHGLHVLPTTKRVSVKIFVQKMIEPIE